MSTTEQDVPASVLLVGGPDTGKSNYLFRLWLAIDEGAGSLEKSRLPDEIGYLRGGAELLMSGEFAKHTSRDVHEQVVIPVRSLREPQRSGLLRVPDMAGEKIQHVYKQRQWGDEWEASISKHCSCLLFVRVGSALTVPALDPSIWLEAFGAPLDPKGGGPQGDVQYATPTEVVLTDWLQFLRRAFTDKVGGRYRPRIGVVVTAWDALRAGDEDIAPNAYLAREMPLLSQFLDSAKEQFSVQIFGVSILSGDVGLDPEAKERVTAGRPTDYGYSVHALSGPFKKDSDVAVPVTWALGWYSDSVK